MKQSEAKIVVDVLTKYNDSLEVSDAIQELSRKIPQLKKYFEESIKDKDNEDNYQERLTEEAKKVFVEELDELRVHFVCSAKSEKRLKAYEIARQRLSV